MNRGETDYKIVFLVLLLLGVGAFLVGLIVILSKRCRRGTQSSILHDFWEELGYRERSGKDNASFRQPTQFTPWRASAGWESRTYSFNSNSRPISSIVIKVSQVDDATASSESEQNENQLKLWNQPSLLQVPLQVVLEEEENPKEIMQKR